MLLKHRPYDLNPIGGKAFARAGWRAGAKLEQKAGLPLPKHYYRSFPNKPAYYNDNYY